MTHPQSGSVLQPLAGTLHSSSVTLLSQEKLHLCWNLPAKPADISQWRVLASKHWPFQVKTHSVETLLNNFRAVSPLCRKLVVCHGLTVLFFSFLFQKGSPGKYKNNLRWKSHSKLSNIFIPWNFKFQKAIQILKPLHYKKTKNVPAVIFHSIKAAHIIVIYISYICLCIYLMQSHPYILAAHLQCCLLALLKVNRVEWNKMLRIYHDSSRKCSQLDNRQEKKTEIM